MSPCKENPEPNACITSVSLHRHFVPSPQSHANAYFDDHEIAWTMMTQQLRRLYNNAHHNSFNPLAYPWNTIGITASAVCLFVDHLGHFDGCHWMQWFVFMYGYIQLSIPFPYPPRKSINTSFEHGLTGETFLLLLLVCTCPRADHVENPRSTIPKMQEASPGYF